MSNSIKYISDISEEDLKNNIVLPFTNDSGLSCIMIKNDKNKNNPNVGKTDYLEFHLNSLVTRNDNKFYVHIIICKKRETYALEQFDIAYKYLFKEIKKPISDYDLSILIQSFEALFKISNDRDLSKLQTGVYGELLTLYYLYQNGCSKIFSKFHKNFYSKHDFEIDSSNRIEVKSTVSSKRIHSFSHDQLMRTDINVFVSSLLFEVSSEGVSLYKLFDMVLEVASNSDLFLIFGKLKGLCGVSIENQGVRFSFDKAINDIRFYDSKSLPHIDKTSYPGVFNIEYDVDCSMSEPKNVAELIGYFNSLL